MLKPIKIAIAGSGYGRKVALPVYAELEEFEPVQAIFDAVRTADIERRWVQPTPVTFLP